MRWRLAVAFVLLGFAPAWAAKEQKVKEEKLDGYAEWRQNGALIVDGQRLKASSTTKLKLPKGISSLAAVELGSEVRAKGTRAADGTLIAREIEVKPNGSAMFEGEAKRATSEMEAKWLSARRVYEEGEDGEIQVLGKLYTSGHDVDHVRRIVRDLLPPYLGADDFRVYVVENDEWNAFACANGMIVVYSAMLEDMDDDELAIILGHEIAHATHEHTRREFKKAFWGQLVAAGVSVAAESIDDETARSVVQLAAVFSFMAWKSGYGRNCEDQADRVGLRYAYEAGYDVTKGPGLWDRFARKYGENNKVVNFFFSDHSLSSARARHLEHEIAVNYPDAHGDPARARARLEEDRDDRRSGDDDEDEDESADEYDTDEEEANAGRFH